METNIKKLPKSVHIELERQNKARRLADLPQLTVQVKVCHNCGRRYESLNNRRCGCTSYMTTSIQGRELI